MVLEANGGAGVNDGVSLEQFHDVMMRAGVFLRFLSMYIFGVMVCGVLVMIERLCTKYEFTFEV